MSAKPLPTKERLIAAAIRHARSVGHQRTVMEEIAEEAGITRQALYRHYPTKDALFREAVKFMQARALEDAEKAAGAAQGAEAALFAMLHTRFDRMLALVDGSPHAAELLEDGARLCADINDEAGKRFEKQLMGAIGKAEAAGALTLRRGVTAAKLAQMLLCAARGAKHDQVSRRAFRRDLKDMTDVILAGAAAPQRARRSAVS